MKIIVFLCFLSAGFLFGQEALSDTIRIDRLSDQEVKEMITRCWPTVKDTIYYGEYFDGIKLSFSRYAHFLDSNNRDYGPVLLYDIYNL